MDRIYITPTISIVVVAVIAFTYTRLQSSAHDRRWGKRPPAE